MCWQFQKILDLFSEIKFRKGSFFFFWEVACCKGGNQDFWQKAPPAQDGVVRWGDCHMLDDYPCGGWLHCRGLPLYHFHCVVAQLASIPAVPSLVVSNNERLVGHCGQLHCRQRGRLAWPLHLPGMVELLLGLGHHHVDCAYSCQSLACGTFLLLSLISPPSKTTHVSAAHNSTQPDFTLQIVWGVEDPATLWHGWLEGVYHAIVWGAALFFSVPPLLAHHYGPAGAWFAPFSFSFSLSLFLFFSFWNQPSFCSARLSVLVLSPFWKWCHRLCLFLCSFSLLLFLYGLCFPGVG